MVLEKCRKTGAKEAKAGHQAISLTCRCHTKHTHMVALMIVMWKAASDFRKNIEWNNKMSSRKAWLGPLTATILLK